MFKKISSILLCFLLIAVFILACSEDRQEPQIGKDDITMKNINQEKVNLKPPLDQNIPEDLETVTLAMG